MEANGIAHDSSSLGAGRRDKREVGDKMVEDLSKYAHSPAHLAVARRDHASLRRIVSALPRLAKAGEVHTEAESIAAELQADEVSSFIDRRDVPGRETPLHLAVRLRDFQLANESSSLLSLSPKFILPEDERPQLSEVTSLDSIPIIDLSDHSYDGNNHSSSLVVQKISQACEEYGFFQIVNHGIPEQVCNKMMTAITDIFNLPPEQTGQLYTTDHTKNTKLYNYYLNVEGGEKVKMWSECFSHYWYPIEDIIHLLPQEIGTQYGEAFSEYAREIGSLVRRLLGLLSIGLGIEEDFLLKIFGDQPRLRAQANFYPPCPDPELTLGLPVHTDFNALTIVLQSQVSGLQVIKDGKWIAVPVIPNAFVINLGDQIQVLSNGRFKSVHHRAVTNKLSPRVSMAMFYGPNVDTTIGPIQDLIDEEHPPRYRNYRFSEFLEEFFKQEGTRRMVKEVFELPC